MNAEIARSESQPPGTMDLDRAIRACLAGLSPNTQRAYQTRIRHYCAWLAAGGRQLSRESVTLWIDSLTVAGQSGMACNQALSAVKRLAQEAASLGWLSWETAVQIASIRSRKYRGVRTGQWLTIDQLRALLAAPDRGTLQGKRDACVLALLAGCGMRREEACQLTAQQCQWKLGEHGPVMEIRNLEGKGNRVRTLQVPAWAARDIQAWMESAGITTGKLLRSFKTHD